ncbi:MAG UNVERIFIED_CONTAM: hypothetical protein LVT10_03760 [Anaerolineae bacterium]
MKPSHTSLDQPRPDGAFNWESFTRYWLDVVFPRAVPTAGDWTQPYVSPAKPV